MKYTFLLLISVLLLGTAQAQELSPIKKDYRTSVSISKAEVVSETSERLNLSFDCQVKAGKKYSISGIALDKNKQPIAEVQAESQELAEGESLTDLSFRFRQLKDANYDNPKMETHFIQVVLREKSRASELLEKYRPSNKKDTDDSKRTNLNDALAVKYLYPYQKEWRVGGNASMLIEVSLSPIGKARIIRN